MSTARLRADPAVADPLLPRPVRLRRRRREIAGVWSLELAPADGGTLDFAPGQFSMLTVFGIGEVPISVSGRTADGAGLVHTVRAVGAVSAALCALRPGDVLGLRGPYGNGWPVAEAAAGHTVVMAGGLGLAPLRPAVEALVAEGVPLLLLYGARSPAEILFARDLARWATRPGVRVAVTVDHAGPEWRGHVGVVTKLVPHLPPEAADGLALLCGPEIMMRFAAAALGGAGLAEERIFLSMERNMKCAVGLCGHCQFGPHFVCRDGPVFRLDAVASLLRIEEL